MTLTGNGISNGTYGVRKKNSPLIVSGLSFCFVEHARLELATS